MKKYRFLQALDMIVGTQRRMRREGETYWMVFYSEDGTEGLKNEVGTFIKWPTIEEHKAEIWEVEDEVLYMWAYSSKEGDNRVVFKRPIQCSDEEYGEAWEPSLDSGLSSYAFPTDKPQKFKLVPVEDEDNLTSTEPVDK